MGLVHFFSIVERQDFSLVCVTERRYKVDKWNKNARLAAEEGYQATSG